ALGGGGAASGRAGGVGLEAQGAVRAAQAVQAIQPAETAEQAAKRPLRARLAQLATHQLFGALAAQVVLLALAVVDGVQAHPRLILIAAFALWHIVWVLFLLLRSIRPPRRTSSGHLSDALRSPGQDGSNGLRWRLRSQLARTSTRTARPQSSLIETQDILLG